MKTIGEIAIDREMELKAPKKMALEIDQCRKWINDPNLRGSRGT